jgi:DNA mismatch repair ATPase MutS
MLENEYDLYHFTETVKNNELHFDHIIKPGQLRTRNAIKLLEFSNYPADIIKEARQISTAIGKIEKMRDSPESSSGQAMCSTENRQL